MGLRALSQESGASGHDGLDVRTHVEAIIHMDAKINVVAKHQMQLWHHMIWVPVFSVLSRQVSSFRAECALSGASFEGCVGCLHPGGSATDCASSFGSERNPLSAFRDGSAMR